MSTKYSAILVLHFLLRLQNTDLFRVYEFPQITSVTIT